MMDAAVIAAALVHLSAAELHSSEKVQLND